MFYVHPIHHDFEVGNKVIDITAEENGWSDKNAIVIDIDGSQVKVEYTSGNVRWKRHINLRHSEDE